MTDTDTVGETAAAHGTQADEPALPEAIYPLRDGSYGDRRACDADRSGAEDGYTPPLPWGKGALLLNAATRSYLTPYGFKTLFERSPKTILDRFERAGLDPEKSYFHEGAPDILIHGSDGRFIPPSDMPDAEAGVPLARQFREEDIYLQNFNHDGSKHTGSYTSYARATDVLKELYSEALEGGFSSNEDDAESGDEADASEGKAPEKQRSFNHRPRGRGMTRRTARRPG